MRDFGKALQGQEVPSDLGSEGLSKRCKDYLDEKLVSIIIHTIDGPSDDKLAQISKMRDVLFAYWPNIDRNEMSALYLWPDLKARAKGRVGRQPMRIGRALRRMFPVLTDVEIDRLVDEIKAELFARKFTLHSGSDAVSFKRAYSYQQASYENLDTTWSKKHMCNSCMRHEFDHLPKHPTEAYASGDFEVYWLEDTHGKIGGRVVVQTSMSGMKITPQPAPIYAVSELAYEQLRNHLYDIGATDPANASWTDARLVRTDYAGGFVAPYLDLEPRHLEESDCGNYLVVTHRGSIDASNYSGLLGADTRAICHECQDRIEEGYDYNAFDHTYCEDCYCDLFTTCENCHEPEARDETSTVFVDTRFGNMEQTWCSCCSGDSAVETVSGELWSDCSVRRLADGSYVDVDTFDKEYFECHLSEECYPLDEGNLLCNGLLATIEAIMDYNQDCDLYQYIFSDLTGEWVLTPKEKDTTQCTA